MQTIESWGRYPKVSQTAVPFSWGCDSLPPAKGSVLPFGLGRSYGDSCLNEGGTSLVTSGMNRILDFNPTTGVIRCEAGLSLDAILKFAVPRGWFLPTTPGTKFVTVGGAIANDIHGKNHHRAGTFGCHVGRFELLRSDGSRLLCSPCENRELFSATIGGLGLTGMITWAEFVLRRVQSAFMETESVRFRNLDEFFDLSAASDQDFEYTVSWVDCLAKGNSLGRGILMRGNHSSEGTLIPHADPQIAMPIDLPAGTLNRISVQAFNSFYHIWMGKRRFRRQHYNPFFYPLDFIDGWNRIYGKRGFFQYQFVVPFSSDNAAIREIFFRIAHSGQGSFLAVLKTFGATRSPGLLSFPAPGVTLALDFSNGGKKTAELFASLNEVVIAAGGRFYPAKDAMMPAEVFQKNYPQWREFQSFMDPAFSSSFWRRVTSGS